MSYVGHTDLELLPLIKEDNRVAFRELYERYAKKLFQFVLQKTGNRELASEIVQETFVTLWERRSNLLVANVEAYLFTAVKYQIIDFLREKTQNQQKFISDFSEADVMVPEPRFTTEEFEAALELGLKSLPDKTRIIFEMSRYEQLSNKEIASQLDLSEKAIEYHITQALRHLRLQLSTFINI